MTFECARVPTWERCCTRAAKELEIPLLAAAVLTIPATLIQESHLRHPWPRVATGLNWIIWLAFLVDVVVVLAVAPAKRAWLWRHPVELMIVALTPPVFLPGLQTIRVLRLLRPFRLLRLFPLVRVLLSAEGLVYAASLAVLTAVAGGAAFAAVEKHSLGAGIYWAITTMTTVGDNISPTTTGGRIIAVIVMFVGIGTATLVIGAVASRFAHMKLEPAPGDVADADQTTLAAQVHGIAAQVKQVQEMLQRSLDEPRRSQP